MAARSTIAPAPEKGQEVNRFAETLAKTHGLAVKFGKCVSELVWPGADKGGAVRAFMDDPDFAGATPVFIGDDLTDEDGFAAVDQLGGFRGAGRRHAADGGTLPACLRRRGAPLARSVSAPQPQSSLELWPIGNCQVSGLIDGRAGLVWGCVPRVDGDPVFCALLNGDRQDVGVWRFELVGQVSASQSYERNTPILVTRLEAEDGSAVEITDFCPRFERSGRMYRPVAFIRTVRPVAGSPRLKVVLKPMRGYGREPAETTSGTNHIRYLVG